MKVTKSIIKDLMIYLIGFGICIGIVFPFFMLLFGVDKSVALSAMFVVSCITAGAIVGTVNIFIVKKILISRLREMSEKMNMIKSNVVEVASGDAGKRCDLNICQINISSNDELGEGVKIYNQLVETLSLTMSGERLVRHLDKKSVVSNALPQLLEESSSEAGAIIVEREGELRIIESFGIKNKKDLCKNEIVITVAESGESAYLQYPKDIIVDGILSEIRPKEIVVHPLLFNDVKVGVLLLASVKNYDDQKLEKIGILKKNLSLALHNAEIHEQIQKLAAIDPLTNVYNRRFGMSRLKDEFSRAMRAKSSMSLVLLDLDHFKNINDVYGHIAGDKALVDIAKLLQENIRTGDIIMRFGGEEFLIILPAASKKNAIEIAEKMREKIENTIIRHSDDNISLTGSFGVTSIPENSFASELEMISSVDEALYKSKDGGRNRTTYK